MVSSVREESDVTIKFGGGVHSRASEEDIDEHECAAGENGLLVAGDLQFKPRPPFDLIGTLPNAGSVRGGATLLKSDGTVSTLFQGGSKIYEWDGASTFTEVATVDASSKLRGRFEHNWQISDKVLLTDLALVESVKEWDGSTFQDVSFTDEDGNAFGTFKARYCYVTKERGIFANVESNDVQTPHLVVGSKLTDYTQITVANTPSSALSEADPWYLVQPDNFYINGIVEGVGQTVISSRLGSMYKLTGSSAKDFALDTLMQRAGVIGDESLVLSGTDIFFGRPGAIESVIDTEKSGDVELNDVSFWISDQIETLNDWLLVNNRRLGRTYCYPVGEALIWTLFESVFRVGALSPWMKYTTKHALDFKPTFMMNMLDPSDTLEYVFMGDGSGNVYRMEGSGSGDGGATAVDAFRLSKLIAAPRGKMFDSEGVLKYRKNNAVTATLTFEFSGEHVMKNAINIAMPATNFAPVYGTTYYYGTENFYGVNSDTLSAQRFAVPGAGTELQIRIAVEDTADWAVNQLRLSTTIAG